MSGVALPAARRGVSGYLPGVLLGALIMSTLIAVALTRPAGGARTALPQARLLLEQNYVFTDGPDGEVSVSAPGTPGLTRTLPAGTHNFIRGVLRGLSRERRQHGLGPEAPFTLAQWADGRLSLKDTATGRIIALESFGPTNAAEFRQLLSPAALPAREKLTHSQEVP